MEMLGGLLFLVGLAPDPENKKKEQVMRRFIYQK